MVFMQFSLVSCLRSLKVPGDGFQVSSFPYGLASLRRFQVSHTGLLRFAGFRFEVSHTGLLRFAGFGFRVSSFRFQVSIIKTVDCCMETVDWFRVSGLKTADCRLLTDDWFRVLGLKTVEGMQSLRHEGMASLVTRVSIPSFGQGFKPLHNVRSPENFRDGNVREDGCRPEVQYENPKKNMDVPIFH